MSGHDEVEWSGMPDMCRFYESVPCVTGRTVFVYQDGRAAAAARLPCAELMAYAAKTQGVWTAVEAFEVLQCLVMETKVAETSFPAFVAADSASERLLAPWTTQLTRQCVETGQTLETALVVHPVVRACIGQAFFFSQPISDELLFKTVISLKLCDELPASFAWLLSHQNLPKFHQVSTTLDLLFQHCDQLPNSIVFVFKHQLASVSVAARVARRIRTLLAPLTTLPLDAPFTLSAAAFAHTPPSPNALKAEFAVRAALLRIREREVQLFARLQVAAVRRKAATVAKLFDAFLAQTLPENFPLALLHAALNDRRAASMLATAFSVRSCSAGASGSSGSAAAGVQSLREMEARHAALCSVLDACVQWTRDSGSGTGSGCQTKRPTEVTTRTSSRQSTPGTRPVQLQPLERRQMSTVSAAAYRTLQQKRSQERTQQRTRQAMEKAGSNKTRGLMQGETVRRVVSMKF